MKKRGATYLRVSKGEQATANQRPDVQRLVRARKLHIVAEYEEKASAAKARAKFHAMMRDAHQGKFDVLVVWALDRFGRSMVGNLQRPNTCATSTGSRPCARTQRWATRSA
jgi:DNA invertase Pin-like site-specific DNA recombinase